ncbi:MAG: histidine phosphatase family protein [Sphingobacteriales bacterium]|nr:histidine phosphatase family protein [Sphingobacteriales bacterium]
MKTLILIRHAKSSWEFPELEDRERPLKKRGKNDAALIADYMLGKKILPDVWFSSPAVRALSTANIIADILEKKLKTLSISIDKRLYFEGVEAMLAVVHQLPSEAKNAVLFGHNPDISSFINYLSSDDEMERELPTCGLVQLRFDIKEWKQIAAGGGKFFMLLYPSMLKGNAIADEE